jgi:esterase/lipase superfamily enzyme
LRAGICTVSFSSIWGLNEISESASFYIPDETIKLTDLKEIELDKLFSEIARFPQKDNGNIVIYLHGYNIDFEKSCRRSALFQRAIGLHNRLLLFSWPADGNMLKYTWDESDLVWSVPHIAQFIEEVVKRAGKRKVDVVAHSLGARGVVQALNRLAYNKPPNVILNELVLIAPDIDTDIFRQELPVIKSSVNRLTVYVSENDKALRLSHEVHGYPRLGEAGENLTIFEGVETIDISEISNRRISGHLYHLFNPEVIEDLTQLLHTGLSASRRSSLKIERNNDLPYWQMMTDN